MFRLQGPGHLMSRYFIPGLLFGCGAVPVIAAPSANTVNACATVDIEPESRPGDRGGSSDASAKQASGWAERFGFWSMKSQAAMIDAISAKNGDSAEQHEQTALAHVWKAVSAIPDHEFARFAEEQLLPGTA